MFRPSFSLGAVTQVDLQMSSKVVCPGESPPLTVGPALCEDGRPYLVDPNTGRKICACSLAQTDALYESRLLVTDTRNHEPALQTTVCAPSIGFDASAFYSPLIRNGSIRSERIPTYLTSPMPGQPMTFDPTLSTHPYGLLYAGVDMNGGPIRKAATRETTGPLKIWLSDHKKNPYPTKAEKIMLAIITRMTLTQVSTWFANARRRLKKENKLYPSDRDNRTDDDNDTDDISHDNRDENTSQNDGSENRLIGESDDEDINVDLSDSSDEDEDVFRHSSIKDLCHDTSNRPHIVLERDPQCTESSHSEDITHTKEQENRTQNSVSQNSELTDAPVATSIPSSKIVVKPKIWSVSEIINGSTVTKDSHMKPSGLSAGSLQTTTSLTLSKHVLASSSSTPTRLSLPAASIVMRSPAMSLLPTLSSSSPVSPTAYQTMSSVLGLTSSHIIPRLGLQGGLGSYGPENGTNGLLYIRSSHVSTGRGNTMENASHSNILINESNIKHSHADDLLISSLEKHRRSAYLQETPLSYNIGDHNRSITERRSSPCANVKSSLTSYKLQKSPSTSEVCDDFSSCKPRNELQRQWSARNCRKL